MLLRPFIAATGLAAITSAFLLQPQISDVEVDILESLPVEKAHAQAQTINLDCAGCPPVFQHKHHNKPKKHHKQHSSHLELDFATEQGRLTVNGFELYPNADPFANILVASQIADKKEHKKDHRKQHNKHHKDGDNHNTKALKSHHKWRPSDAKAQAVEQQLGFSLQVQPVVETSDANLELLVVDLQIIEVGSVFVEGLSNVRVHLIKSPENDLLIGQIEQTPSQNKASAPGAECTTILCQWRAMLAAQLAKLKMHKCAGMLGHKAGPAGHHHPHGQAHGGHMHHQGGHNQHHRQSHGWALLFRKLTSHIILPVLVGIVAGVTVSILGMIVGTLLVGLWRTLVRGQSFLPSHTCRRFGRASHRHHHNNKASHTEAALVEEKSALMASQEDDELPPPPAYKDDDAEAEHVERV